jgi:hypothetical protein
LAATPRKPTPTPVIPAKAGMTALFVLIACRRINFHQLQNRLKKGLMQPEKGIATP